MTLKDAVKRLKSIRAFIKAQADFDREISDEWKDTCNELTRVIQAMEALDYAIRKIK